ncbi:MAG: aminoglycoside phosphotransferase family protein [Chloroflexi bacterium]|nr:aminoglycoside phosphotransferase family protein [Chloroflexota bacterium]MBV9602852.1 aminoglycoside phosphotransferase family protein [Chloroflexota bacterium]
MDQLVSLCDLQSGRGGWLAEVFPTRPTWAEEAVYAVTHGYAEYDYCDMASLQAHSPATNELLRVVQTLVERHADEMDVDHADIVHYDFSPANLLLNEQQRVVGVVDWEGVRVGDRLFDLATQLFMPPARARFARGYRRPPWSAAGQVSLESTCVTRSCARWISRFGTIGLTSSLSGPLGGGGRPPQ